VSGELSFEALLDERLGLYAALLTPSEQSALRDLVLDASAAHPVASAWTDVLRHRTPPVTTGEEPKPGVEDDGAEARDRGVAR